MMGLWSRVDVVVHIELVHMGCIILPTCHGDIEKDLCDALPSSLFIYLFIVCGLVFYLCSMDYHYYNQSVFCPFKHFYNTAFERHMCQD